MSDQSPVGQFGACPKSDWNNGARRCPHGCGVACKRNAAKQREHGKRLEKRFSNLTLDDLQWLTGTGRYGQ